jgi:hypothetical protein
MRATHGRLEGRAEPSGSWRSTPSPWGELAVRRVVGDDSEPTAVAEIAIVAPTDVFCCARKHLPASC